MKDQEQNIFLKIIWDHLIVRPAIIKTAIEYIAIKKRERKELKEH